MRQILSLAAAIALSLAMSAIAADAPTFKESPVGGANSPEPSPPPKLVIGTAELAAGSFAIKVPTGAYTAPAGGAPAYSVPGPIVAFKGADGIWRGHGYLETYPRLLKFNGSVQQNSADLDYQFDSGKSYKVKITVASGVVLIEETSNLGPRNLFVFDCYYGGDDAKRALTDYWLPASGFVTDLAGGKHAFLYLPCYYDKPEATINPLAKAAGADAKAAVPPGGVAVLSAEAGKKDVAGFWCRDIKSWQNGESMGIQLWQHRQRPGDPASRHFLGPETKSDSTPNPRTAPLMGRSLYEGHVTIELSLGTGTRKLGFIATSKGDTKDAIPLAFEKAVAANQ